MSPAEIRRAALEEAAAIADAYADENIRMAQDTIMADPVLMGTARSPADLLKSRDLMVEGCVHSSMYHAAQNIAGAIRQLMAKEVG